MTILEEAIITASITILGGILIFLITKLIEKRFIEPYYKYKEGLITIKIDLLFYKNILTNSFTASSVNSEFAIFIRNALKDLRRHWARISTYYYNIHSKKIFSKRLPTYEENKKIESTLLVFSNSLDLILRSNNVKNDISNECIKRNEEIEKTIKLIEKYI